MTSQTTMMLKGNDSEDETEVENQQEKGPETVITVKSSKRKFTEEYEPPPVKITKTIPATVPIVPENLPIPAPTESQPAPVVPAPIAPPSSFTAVTPSGEEASIATLRQKQAARRAKALLFLNAKKKLQEQENGSKGTPERNITASAATEDIFDLSNPSSPATVDSPSRTAEKEGEVSRPKRTSRFDILPRGMTSLPLAVTQHPVMSAGPTPGYLSSRSSSRRHKHRSHDYRRHSDDDRSPSNHRSSRRYSRKTESRDSSKTSKRKKEKRRRKSRSKSRSSSNRSSSEREESQTKHSKVRHREKSRGGSSEDTSDVTPTHSARDKNNDDVASDVSVTSEKYRSEGELTS
uniref:splicing factor, suppressor of white-apricot homolog isoform X3 n=1 Tax=Ciona intestinalis TaxID=7719 RepID=UPI000EF4A3DC|nr:splicing factor, suppressor of white-apricot homolog isoform X3 [Ciona intestinalis]|eukprot:XP_026692114.1 splicing factor, suppressor of white-apricot homolog isoform X3 [Ciona intestinalis]